MSHAWTILTALTIARLSMGFQFQAIPALAAPLTSSGVLSHAALGTLTGAYLLPGVAAALAGGWLGQKVGDSRTALWGLGLMIAGGVGGWLSDAYAVSLGWRVVAGCGAVGLNVMVTKMAADWFQQRADLPTAMGVLVSSWPAGIAFAMLLLPPIAMAIGLGAALLAPAAMCAVSLVMLAVVWRPPARAAPVQKIGSNPLPRRDLVLVLAAGSIWGLYNAALVAAIAWTPGVLRDSGLGDVPASAAVSVIGWVAILSVAAGGWLASRLSRKDLPALACFVLSAALLIALPALGRQAASPWVMATLGLAIGPAAAMIMTLPVEASTVQARSLAMGIYFAIYYGVMGIAPAALGALRDATGNAALPLHTAAGMMVICVCLWLGFRAAQRRSVA